MARRAVERPPQEFRHVPQALAQRGWRLDLSGSHANTYTEGTQYQLRFTRPALDSDHHDVLTTVDNSGCVSVSCKAESWRNAYHACLDNMTDIETRRAASSKAS